MTRCRRGQGGAGGGANRPRFCFSCRMRWRRVEPTTWSEKPPPRPPCKHAPTRPLHPPRSSVYATSTTRAKKRHTCGAQEGAAGVCRRWCGTQCAAHGRRAAPLRRRCRSLPWSLCLRRFIPAHSVQPGGWKAPQTGQDLPCGEAAKKLKSGLSRHLRRKKNHHLSLLSGPVQTRRAAV